MLRPFLFLSYFAIASHLGILFADEQDRGSQSNSELVDIALDTLKHNSIKRADGTISWNSWITNKRNVPLLGKKGKRYEDQNNFVPAKISDSILKVLKTKPNRQEEFREILEKSLLNLERYKNEETGSFGFWEKKPFESFLPEKVLKKIPTKLHKNLATLPSKYPLNSRFAIRRSQIYEDADDSAYTYSAYFNFHQLYNEQLPFFPAQFEETVSIFEKWRDLQENKSFNSHLYLKQFGMPRNSGAYLTWHGKENIPLHFAPIFMTWNKVGLAEGINNVDCLVNANVLNYLSRIQSKDTPGYKQACKAINQVVSSGKSLKCPIYYPSFFHLHYAVMDAIENGASCLKPASGLLIDEILRLQQSDGSFPSTFHTDTFTSTLLATSALKLADSNQQFKSSIDKGTDYLKSIITVEQGRIKSPSMTVFSGGMFVKNSVNWESEDQAIALLMVLFNQKFSDAQSFFCNPNKNPCSEKIINPLLGEDFQLLQRKENLSQIWISETQNLQVKISENSSSKCINKIKNHVIIKKFNEYSKNINKRLKKYGHKTIELNICLQNISN